MSLAMFYHLTRSTPQETMATILPRAMSAGWKVMLRGTDDAALQALDTALWTHPGDSFLPHGMAGGPHDADQPILLGQAAIANAAEGLMLIDGAETTPIEAEALQRVWVLFDGADESALNHARRLWSSLTTAGIAAQYWSEESGRWQKKTEKLANA